MKLFYLSFALILIGFPVMAQEQNPQVASSQEEDTAQSSSSIQSEQPFSTELRERLYTLMEKRYAKKDLQTMQMRKKLLERELKRQSLSYATRQRYIMEWQVIQGYLSAQNKQNP